MKVIANMPFPRKLILLVLPALLGLLYFAGIRMLQLVEVRNSAVDIEQLVTVASLNSSLVHELQRERGATAGFIGSAGARFGDVLSKQRSDTDKAAGQRNSILADIYAQLGHQKVRSQLDSITAELKKLATIRAAVSGQQIALAEAIGYYTALNGQLLAVTTDIARLAADGNTANGLQAYYNFLQGKERAGIERAVLSGTFARDKFSPTGFQPFVELVTEQKSYFDTLTKPQTATAHNFSMRKCGILRYRTSRECVLLPLKSRLPAGSVSTAPNGSASPLRASIS